MNKRDSSSFFYRVFNRTLTLMELASLRKGGVAEVVEECNAAPNALVPDMARRKQDLLLDEKWKLLMKRARWFRVIPFLEFVIASGSMAIGNVHKGSDFDVLIGVRKGRIFTVRYLLNFVFSILGARRLDDNEGTSPNKLCFNHFVTEPTFAKEPFNFYRAELYRMMVPIYGSREALTRFFRANSWSGADPERNMEDLRFREKKPNAVRGAFEALLGGGTGNYIEQKIFMPIAMRRLKTYIKTKEKGGRVVISEEELEFHFELPYEKEFADLTFHE